MKAAGAEHVYQDDPNPASFLFIYDSQPFQTAPLPYMLNISAKKMSVVSGSGCVGTCPMRSLPL